MLPLHGVIIQLALLQTLCAWELKVTYAMSRHNNLLSNTSQTHSIIYAVPKKYVNHEIISKSILKFHHYSINMENNYIKMNNE